MNIKEKSVSSAKWLMGNNVAQKVISVGTFIVLARILKPEVFGLFAMTFVVLDGFSIFKYFGIDSALIQRQKDVETASHTAYWLVLAMGLVLFMICQLIAPLCAQAFKNEDVLPVLRALGFIIIFTSFGKIPRTLLAKELRYREISYIEVLGALSNSAVAITLALMGYGVWSLVAAYLVKQIQGALIAYSMTRYKPRLQFDPKIAKELFDFGKYLFAMALFWYLAVHVDHFVIARFLGAAALGYFALAFNITEFVNKYFVSMLTRVLFPAYAKLQSDAGDIKRGFLKTVKFVSILTFPLGPILMIAGPELVITVYGPQWRPVIIPLQVLAFASIYSPLFACQHPAFLALGEAKTVFKLNVIQFIVKIPIMIFCSIVWGIPGAACGLLIAGFAILPINLRYLRSILNVRLKEVFPLLQAPAICALGSCVYMFALKMLLPFSKVDGQVGQLIYLFALLMPAFVIYIYLYKRVDTETFDEIKDMLFKRKNASSQKLVVSGNPQEPNEDMNVSPPDLSMIIATHNRAESLRDTLRAVLDQDVPKGLTLELIVVDNASQDHTARVIKEYKTQVSFPVYYIYEGRLGKSNALNAGIQQATGELLLFTDDDVVPPKQWIEKIWQGYKTYDADCLGGPVAPLWEVDPPVWLKNEKKFWDMLAIIEGPKQEGLLMEEPSRILIGANMAIRREVLRELGPYTRDMGPKGRGRVGGDDTEMVDRIAAAGKNIVFIPEAFVDHKIPKKRMRLGYFRQWKFASAQHRILLEASTKKVPFWLFFECMNQAWGSLWARLTRREDLVIKRDLSLAYRLGEFWAYIKISLPFAKSGAC